MGKSWAYIDCLVVSHVDLLLQDLLECCQAQSQVLMGQVVARRTSTDQYSLSPNPLLQCSNNQQDHLRLPPQVLLLVPLLALHTKNYKRAHLHLLYLVKYLEAFRRCLGRVLDHLWDNLNPSIETQMQPKVPIWEPHQICKDSNNRYRACPLGSQVKTHLVLLATRHLANLIWLHQHGRHLKGGCIQMLILVNLQM